MDFEQKQRLAHQNDMGLAACAIRLRAARAFTGLSQQNLAKEIGTTKQVLNNAEAGLTHPNRTVMKHLYRAYRIDFNFMMNGDFAQLPGDVQEKLFAALEAANNEWDQREG
ncbi:helix-turn-helix transcriptional regulator [Phaeovulum sp. W22_SRMD_FR3]|uniref:helix-turn-helix transcriptional regulator n=1 Tax=Phaeovulum sp. W22_SRMD_FR3 TaxID=3240274 RepID=UPI003F9C4C29